VSEKWEMRQFDIEELPLGNDVGPPSCIAESFSRLDVPSDIDTMKGNVLPSKVPGQLHQNTPVAESDL